MYYETMEQVLSKVDKTIVEAPGVTPYLPLPQVAASAAAAAGAAAMIDFIRRRPLLSAIIGVLHPRCSCSAASRSFRRPSRRSSSASASRCGSSITMRPAGRSARPAPGIAWRIPFAEQIVWIDKRVQDVDMQRQQVLSTDQRRLEVDAFARYRIVDPLLMYIRAGTEQQLTRAAAADSRLGSPQRARPASSSPRSCRPSGRAIMDSVRTSLNRIARQYGVEIIDVRIKHTDLPDGAPLHVAFDRMRTAREQEARSIHAQGAKQAQIIRAAGRRRGGEDLCRELRQGPGILRFLPGDAELPDDLRRRRPGEAVAPTTIILSPQNDYLKEFTGRPR